MFSHKWNCYFQNKIKMFCLPVPTLIYCTCERIIYFQDWSAYSAAGKYVARSWEYINSSRTHECGNWDWGRAIPRKGIHKWDFPCSAPTFIREGSLPGYIFTMVVVAAGLLIDGGAELLVGGAALGGLHRNALLLVHTIINSRSSGCLQTMMDITVCMVGSRYYLWISKGGGKCKPAARPCGIE